MSWNELSAVADTASWDRVNRVHMYLVWKIIQERHLLVVLHAINFMLSILSLYPPYSPPPPHVLFLLHSFTRSFTKRPPPDLFLILPLNILSLCCFHSIPIHPNFPFLHISYISSLWYCSLPLPTITIQRPKSKTKHGRWKGTLWAEKLTFQADKPTFRAKKSTFQLKRHVFIIHIFS